MERNEGVQCPKDLSKLTLRHDVQLQHGLIVHLVAKVRKEYKCTAWEIDVWRWNCTLWHIRLARAEQSGSVGGWKKAPSWPDWGRRWVVSLPESAHRSPAGESKHVKNTKHVDANTLAIWCEIHRQAVFFTADCSIREVEPAVPAHILFHNRRVEQLQGNSAYTNHPAHTATHSTTAPQPDPDIPRTHCILFEKFFYAAEGLQTSRPSYLLTFDLLHSEVVTLHCVTPALAVASAWKRWGLRARPQGGRGQRASLRAKTDRALWKKKRAAWLNICTLESFVWQQVRECVCALLPK